MRISALSVCLLFSAVTLTAQSVDYNLRIYVAGAPAPIGPPNLLPGASVVCNQAAPASTVTRNPNKAVFDDPANAGRVCIYTDPGTGPLLATPTGFQNLEGTITMVSGGAETDESNRAPFLRTPAAPRNVRLVW